MAWDHGHRHFFVGYGCNNFLQKSLTIGEHTSHLKAFVTPTTISTNKLLRTIKLATIAITMAIGSLTSQERRMQRADDAFENHAYMDAISSYEELVDEGVREEEIFKRLGDANYFNARYGQASKWYGKLMEMAPVNMDPELMYRYAQSLKSLKKYGESNKWMERFAHAKKGDIRASMFHTNKDYLEKIGGHSQRFVVKPLAINSRVSDFAPTIKEDYLVFTSARDTGNMVKVIDRWSNKGLLGLYKAKVSENGTFGETVPFDKKLNAKGHESSIVFSKDGKTAYYTRTNDTRGLFPLHKERAGRFKLYRAQYRNGRWSNGKELLFSDDAHSVAHPALSPDGQKLYFASDMEGTLGESDIFYVELKGDGSFGKPVNLGPKINTEGRETFPFISEEGVLFFASDGHPGLGGLDIFATRLDEIYVINLGEPINSSSDDFAYTYGTDMASGYFSSDRSHGNGQDDIYSFTQIEPLVLEYRHIIKGMVQDRNSGIPLPGVRLTLTSHVTKKDKVVHSDEEGVFSFNVAREGEVLKGMGSLKGYRDAEFVIGPSHRDGTTQVAVFLEKEEVLPTMGTDLTVFLDLEPIYFDFDEWYIRSDAKASLEKIVEYMDRFKEIKVRITSHTDSLGSKAYNIRLSDKRAHITKEYLVQRGIDPSRIRTLGLGES
ncbi:MAG: OmpA family protein, partial [Flavobacteriaceae bacterium]